MLGAGDAAIAPPVKHPVPVKAILSLLLAALVALAACAPAAPPPEAALPVEAETPAITVTDALGRSVSWDKPPQRMVIAGRANFMLSHAIYAFPEAPARVVALTQAQQTTVPFLSLLDPAFEAKTRFTTDSTAEEIAGANPDVVFLKRMMRDSIGNSLETLGIPVVYLDLETPEQYERELQLLGDLFGDPGRAETVWRFYATRLARIEEGLADLQALPSALVLQYNPRGGAVGFEVPPDTWMQTRMVTLTGGDPVWVGAGQSGWTTVNLEQIAAWNPERVFIISYFETVDQAVARLLEDPSWQGLRAVQQGQVFGFPKDFYSWDQPDARWILGVTWMATRMHPERFGEIVLQNELNAFYETLYGLDSTTIEAQVLPLLEGDLSSLD